MRSSHMQTLHLEYVANPLFFVDVRRYSYCQVLSRDTNATRSSVSAINQFLGATLLRIELSSVKRDLMGFALGVSLKK
jgi:hypothetical protein